MQGESRLGASLLHPEPCAEEPISVDERNEARGDEGRHAIHHAVSQVAVAEIIGPGHWTVEIGIRGIEVAEHLLIDLDEPRDLFLRESSEHEVTVSFEGLSRLRIREGRRNHRLSDVPLRELRAEAITTTGWSEERTYRD